MPGRQVFQPNTRTASRNGNQREGRALFQLGEVEVGDTVAPLSDLPREDISSNLMNSEAYTPYTSAGYGDIEKAHNQLTHEYAELRKKTKARKKTGGPGETEKGR